MKNKIILFVTFISSLAFAQLSAQTTTTIQGDVTIVDDPATTSVTEGNLRISESLTIGPQQTTIGTNSVSIAGGTALGNASIAVGGYTQAKGEYSLAFGTDSWALEQGSFAFGFAASSTGIYSVTMGSLSGATGSHSIALGVETFSYGSCAVAIGCSSISQGFASFALGCGVTADTFAQVTIGAYNYPIMGNTMQWIDTDPLFVIGNGSENEYEMVPSNALVMLKNGNTTLNGEFKAKKVVIDEPDTGISMGEFAPVAQEP